MGLFSCTPEKCAICEAITESNFKEAQNKCQGLANNYPDYDLISNTSLGTICPDDLKAVRLAYEKSVTKTACTGITYTVRTRVVCK